VRTFPGRSFLAPRFWGVHLLALVCVGAAVWLGAWQYGAWQERRAAEAADLTQSDPIPLAEAMGPDDPFPGDRIGQPVTVDGTWVPEGTVFVSGREHDGRTGYWVVTPLATSSPGGPALPVVRGWVRSPESAPPAPTGPAELVGWLQPPEGSALVDENPDDDVLPELRVADLIQRVDQDLYGAYAVATEPTAGLAPADLDQLPEVGRFTALRNLLYAVEWWFFGAFAVFVWVRWLRDEAESDVSQDTSEATVGSGA
jgi:cytochrome oxidase assembly protein ShyY1